MANGSIQHIIDGLDGILEDEKSLNTRTGLRFSFTLLREAFGVLEEFQGNHQKLDTRVGNLEREREAEKAKEKEKRDEEKWLKRTTLGAALAAVIMLLLNGFIFLASTIPLFSKIIEAAK